MRRRKKSKFKHVVIGSKKYFFYRIEWLDITGDAGHASAEEFDKFECSKMITHGYIYKKTKKFVWTFSICLMFVVNRSAALPINASNGAQFSFKSPFSALLDNLIKCCM